MKDSDKNQINELDLLDSISKDLTDNTDSFDIVESLTKSINKFVKIESFDIYVYDENTKTLKDFSKSWIVIDEFHKSEGADKLYFSLAQFSKFDFFVNGKPYNHNSEGIVFDEDRNTVLFPLNKNNKPYGIIKLTFSESASEVLTKEFFKVLSIAAYEISLKIQNTILANQMQVNIDFHEAMKNIAKIIETQYELNYIIPLIGEMIDRFISDHLIYIFLKKDSKDTELVWPKACRDKKIISTVSKVTAKSKRMLIDDEKIGIFPLIGEKSLLGCIVASSNIDKLNRNEIDYLEQLTNQSSITIHRANVYAEVLQHATLDALTGLNNRRQFEVRLKQEVSTAKRQNKPLCAMMVDVDFFKKVNDTYGHIVGDAVLKNVASIVKSELREYDIASRYGGEEFAILLPFTKIEEAFAVGQRLRNAVEAASVIVPNENDDEELSVNVTISIGVYEYVKTDTPQGLYDNADKALYLAKTHGRNKVVIYK